MGSENMKNKEEFLKEVSKRIKENIDMIESSFELSNIELVKNRLYNIEPEEYHLPILFEDDPYIFLSKMLYAIINEQEIKVSRSNIACELLLEMINLILEEFELERIDKIG